MKKSFRSLFVFLFAAGTCYAADKTGSNPGIFLNPQDVPIFFGNNPLSGMEFFTVITSLPLKDIGMQPKVENSIKKTLETAGQVVRLKDNDMRGFGAGNIFLFQIAPVTGWDGNETSMYRLSLNIETSVTLDRTGKKTFPMVWSINSFLQGPIDSNPEGNLMKATQKLVTEFVQNYRYVNQDQAKKPVFYTYN
jgi:hypothetical protein